MNIVVLGGGTGSFAVLQALKELRKHKMTAIVNMTDDGGSNQVIRDEYGLLPFSDLRKSILALSDDNKNELLRQIFMHRFDKGDGLQGHTLGNLVMMALSAITGNELSAIDAASDLFDVQGTILPVTLERAKLSATFDNGKTINGEHNIDEPLKDDDNSRIIQLALNPEVNAYPKAIEAIISADYIIVGPGDLYTTTLANCIVTGISEAIVKTSGKLLFITNIMTKRGQTRGMSQSEHVEEIFKYLHRKPDIILVHKGRLSEAGLTRYLEVGERVVIDDLPVDKSVLRLDLATDEVLITQKGDSLVRSFIRHDKEKLKKAFSRLFKGSVLIRN